MPSASRVRMCVFGKRGVGGGVGEASVGHLLSKHLTICINCLIPPMKTFFLEDLAGAHTYTKGFVYV
jgi:hypothetical protein